MREKKEYTVEDIISAAQNKADLKAGGELSQRFSLHTDAETTLEPSDAPKVKALINYIESKYKVSLKIVGGGRGCTKFTFHVEGEQGAAELVKKLMRDEEFKELAKGVHFDVVVVPTSFDRYKIEPKHKRDTFEDPMKPKNRVSADGTVQETGTY